MSLFNNFTNPDPDDNYITILHFYFLEFQIKDKKFQIIDNKEGSWIDKKSERIIYIHNTCCNKDIIVSMNTVV